MIPVLLSTLVLSTQAPSVERPGLPSAPTAAGVPTQTAASLLRWVDLDADGDLEALTVDAQGSLHLFEYKGAAGFVDETARWGLAAQTRVADLFVADVDGSEAPDVVVLAEGRLRVLRQSSGAFVDTTAQTELQGLTDVTSMAALDANGDGRADLHVVAGDRHRILVRRPEGGFDEQLLGSSTGGAGAVAPIAPIAPIALGAPGAAATDLRGAAASRAPVDSEGRERGGRGPVDAPDDLGTRDVVPDTAAPESLGVTVSGPTVSGTTLGELPPWQSGRECVDSLADQGGGDCVQASSVPTLGMLYPLGNELFIDSGTGNVGIGTLTPGHALEVAGKIVSGSSNTSIGQDSAIGGGAFNIASSDRSTVAGGVGNSAGYRASVGGGDNNRATGNITTVSGGKLNDALQT